MFWNFFESIEERRNGNDSNNTGSSWGATHNNKRLRRILQQVLFVHLPHGIAGTFSLNNFPPVGTTDFFGYDNVLVDCYRSLQLLQMFHRTVAEPALPYPLAVRSESEGEEELGSDALSHLHQIPSAMENIPLRRQQSHQVEIASITSLNSEQRIPDSPYNSNKHNHLKPILKSPPLQR